MRPIRRVHRQDRPAGWRYITPPLIFGPASEAAAPGTAHSVACREGCLDVDHPVARCTGCAGRSDGPYPHQTDADTRLARPADCPHRPAARSGDNRGTNSGPSRVVGKRSPICAANCTTCGASWARTTLSRSLPFSSWWRKTALRRSALWIAILGARLIRLSRARPREPAL